MFSSSKLPHVRFVQLASLACLLPTLLQQVLSLKSFTFRRVAMDWCPQPPEIAEEPEISQRLRFLECPHPVSDPLGFFVSGV